MKHFFTAFLLLALAFPALAQIPQGTTMRATNGIGFGTTTVAGRLLATNANTTNIFSGLVYGSTIRSTNVWDKSNVKFWGAVGDGVTDDASVFQTALASGLKTISVPDGNYRVWTNLYIAEQQTLILGAGNFNFGTNNRIVLNSGSRILGKGSDNTIISCKITNGAFLASTSAIHSVALENLQVYGSDGGSVGIQMDAWTKSTLRGVKIDRFRNPTTLAGIGLAMYATTNGNCNGIEAFGLIIDNSDTALIMDSTSEPYICGYNRFYGLKIGQQENGIHLLKSTGNGSAYNLFDGVFIQCSAASSSAVLIKIEGINNKFQGLVFDNCEASTNLWFSKTNAAGNVVEAAGLFGVFRDDNYLGPPNTVADGRFTYAPNASFLFIGEGGNIAFDPSSGLEIHYSNPLISRAWNWIMASNASPNLVLASDSGTALTVSQNRQATFSASAYFDIGLFSPIISGGSSGTSDLFLKTTSGAGATGADIHFLVGNNGATEAMTILNNGKVGIGTTNPASNYNLDVFDLADARVNINTTRVAGEAHVSLKNGVAQWNAGVEGNIGTFHVGNGSTLTTAPRISITTNGNVGIGITAPTNKLQVIGAIQATTTVFANAALLTNSLLTKAVFYSTNTFPISPNFSAGMQLFATNASFKFLQPSGVDATKTQGQTTQVFVENTGGSPITVTPPDGVSSLCQPWSVTNGTIAEFKFTTYGGRFTNVAGIMWPAPTP